MACAEHRTPAPPRRGLSGESVGAGTTLAAQGGLDAGLQRAEEDRIAAGGDVDEGLDHRAALADHAVAPRLAVDPDGVVAHPGRLDAEPAAQGHRAVDVVALGHHDGLADPEHGTGPGARVVR